LEALFKKLLEVPLVHLLVKIERQRLMLMNSSNSEISDTKRPKEKVKLRNTILGAVLGMALVIQGGLAIRSAYCRLSMKDSRPHSRERKSIDQRFQTAASTAKPDTTPAQLARAYSRLPLHFEANQAKLTTR
jgi:hypothetical protein